MNSLIIFPDLPEVLIEQVHVAEEIMLTLRTTSPTASCPSCGTLSTRVQSRSTRRLHDLPASGRPVSLILHVRRFFCTKSTCAQKIFTERLRELCRPHAEPHQTAARSAPPAWTRRLGVRQEQTWEASLASAGVVIRSCAWFANRNSSSDQSHPSLVWTTGRGNAGCAMEP